jgi:fused signal recognition particle receptor
MMASALSPPATQWRREAGMAGFFKKLFSFSKKEVIEEKAAEADTAAPLESGPVSSPVLSPADASVAEEIVPAEPATTPSQTEPAKETVQVEALTVVADAPVAEPAIPAEALPEDIPVVMTEPVAELAVELPVDDEPPATGPDEAPAEPHAADIPEPFPLEAVVEPETLATEAVAEPPPETDSLQVVPEPEQPAPVEAVAAPEPSEPPPPAPRREGKVAIGKAVEAVVETVPEPSNEPKKRWYQRLREGLSRSSKELTSSVTGVFTRRKLDEETLEELEDVLIRADLGAETAIRISGALAEGRYGRDISDAEVRAVMAREIEKVLVPVAKPLELDLSHKPHVILVVGVNGTGKTTTIGKLAAKLSQGGLEVMLAAGDTFRAAAIEQLHIWGDRTKAKVVSTKLGADAAGLAWDAYEKAKETGADVLIVDTAGRLQNKAELMAELEKIVRVLGKLDPDAPHTVLQTLDATTGQNALNQVEIFRNVAGVNGLVMTKLDGTARGGILVAIAAKHKLPVYFIGVGEGVDDLEPFAAKDFAEAIAGVGA